MHLVSAASMTSAPGSVKVKSSQKHLSKMPTDLNVNDLLNFTLPPRQQRPIASTPRRSRRTGTRQAVWNKERQYFHFVAEIYDYDWNHPGFVNAQCRFVMNPTGDYTAHFADPDMFVSVRYSRLCGRLSLITDSFNGMIFFRSSYLEPLPCSPRLRGVLSKMTSCHVPYVYPPQRRLESPNAAMSVSHFRFYMSLSPKSRSSAIHAFCITSALQRINGHGVLFASILSMSDSLKVLSFSTERNQINLVPWGQLLHRHQTPFSMLLVLVPPSR